MVNLNTKSGENNCYFNINGGCTNPKITRGIAGDSERDWDSKQGCTFTQDGAQSLCSVYFFQDIYTETKLQEKTGGLMKCRHPYSKCLFMIGLSKKYRKPPKERQCGVADSDSVCKPITDVASIVSV